MATDLPSVGACILRSGMDSVLPPSAVHCAGLKLRVSHIRPDIIITLQGTTHVFVAAVDSSGVVRAEDVEALSQILAR